MDTEANLVVSHDPPSSKLPTPAKPTDKSLVAADVDDIAIIGTAYTVPGASAVLVKHSAKEDSP